MPESKLESRGSPTGVTRWFLRAPIGLYRVGLGFLMGKRFVMIEHKGRKTGKTRRTVLEVVSATDRAVYVAAAWGSKAQWFQNVQADPQVRVSWSSRRFPSLARIIDQDATRGVLADYGSKHPKAFSNLARIMLDDPGASVEENVERVAAVVPLVELPLKAT